MNELSRRSMPVPNHWDRRGLPAWTYHSPAVFALERDSVFLNHWQIIGHENDIPAPGDWLSFDLFGERAVAMRGRDGIVRAFHNLCRHRGARVVDGPQGHCKGAIVCPFHGWVYNLDGTLRGAAQPSTFGDLDRAEFGLKPIELDSFHGFLFIRFHPGPQPDIAALLAPYDQDFAAYEARGIVPAPLPDWSVELPVNWKSVRDVDNEGYHVAMAHPALQDLYGATYFDEPFVNGVSRSFATYNPHAGRRWSVRNYVKIAPRPERLPEHLREAWLYYGMFPNAVIAITPETVQFYQEFPLSTGETMLRGAIYRYADESREQAAARYLAFRIDRDTMAEDVQLSVWSNESMVSESFGGFYLSDLEYGVRTHHDHLRARIPVLELETAPAEKDMWALNDALLSRG